MKEQALERISEEKSEESPSRRFNLRAFLADTFTMTTFGFPIAGANELFIGGMSLDEVGRSRLLALPLNCLIARPYGKYRDFVFSKLGITKESNWIKRYVADTFAFGTSQAPLYAAALYLIGAESEEVYKAAGMITFVAPFLGRPYGAYMDFIRRRFRA